MKYVFFTLMIIFGSAAMAEGTADIATADQNKQHAHKDSHGHQQHGAANNVEQRVPSLVGQYAFATLAEIVSLLEADPTTDWSKVDIESLRQHLIDMDRVTLSSTVAASPIEDGMRFSITSDESSTIASIQRMTQAHAAAQSMAINHEVAEGAKPVWQYAVQLTDNGSEMTVTTKEQHDIERIRALGFIGIMVSGMHHQAHHWSMAKGQNPHSH
jgi:hypothetical protein